MLSFGRLSKHTHTQSHTQTGREYGVCVCVLATLWGTVESSQVEDGVTQSLLSLL